MQLHGDLYMHVGWISNAGSFSHPMLRFGTLVPFESRIASIPLDGTLLCLFSHGKTCFFYVVLSCFIKFGSSSKFVSLIKDIKSWQTHTFKGQTNVLVFGTISSPTLEHIAEKFLAKAHQPILVVLFHVIALHALHNGGPNPCLYRKRSNFTSNSAFHFSSTIAATLGPNLACQHSPADPCFWPLLENNDLNGQHGGWGFNLHRVEHLNPCSSGS